MKRSTLAARLIEASGRGQRKQLLAEHPHLADAALARALKDECYRVWTSSPAAARRIAGALAELSAFSPSREVAALSAWVEGIANITSGKLSAAVESLDAASSQLSRIGNKHEAAQPQVAKLIALAMLGRYDEAQSAGRRALKIFERYDDELAAGKIEMNLSNVVSRRDQYRLAERYCLSAYRRFTRLGETAWRTMAENGLANTYAELNDFKRADRFYARALARARSERMHLTVAEIEASIGNLELFRGRYADALRSLERSRRMYEKLGMPHQTAIAELEIADIYAELNLTAEATDLYRRLVPTLRDMRMRGEEARARSNFGRALIAAGDLRDARGELRRGAALYNKEKNFVAAASVDIQRASLESAADNDRAALKLVDSASATLAASENVRLHLSALWLRGDILIKLGLLDEAEKLLERTLKKARAAEHTAIAQAAMNSLGMIASSKGDAKRAAAFFEAAIGSIETARAPLPGEEFRMAFLAKTLEPYENLTRLLLAERAVEEAFVSVERSRSRSLLDSVERRGAQGSQNESQIREELNWYYSRIDRADADDVARLQTEARVRERKLAAASLRAQSTARRKVSGDARPGIDPAELRRRLGPARSLVEFVVDRGVYSAFVVTGERIDHIGNLASVEDIDAVLTGLRFQFGSVRFGAANLAPFASQLKARADHYLERLYAALIAPLESHIGDRDLVIVPAGALNYVPFHALFNGTQYLVETREIVQTPSAAVWQLLNARRRKTRIKNALLMSFADEKIPLADSEVRRLARTLPNAVKFTGRRATFAAFETHAGRHDVIHLACHGQFRPDNPMFSSLHLADGWVTVRDVCARRLKAELVTLSACETGLSNVFAGEEILGLARGFLSAGAKSLLLSLWTVNDAVTAGLMQECYDSLQRGRTIAASLRIAQVTLIKRGDHPYFWAPFFAIG
jgi:tetratricopeptide (TPR) repeat protein